MFLKRNLHDVMFRYDADASQGGADTKAISDAVKESLQRFLERNGGNANTALETLYTENKEYRDTIRDLKSKVPTEGAVVLSADEAQQWSAYKQFGAVADVQKAIDERTQLQGQLAETQRVEMLRDIASKAGYKPDVLIDLDRIERAKGKTLIYEMRDMTVDGKAVKVPFVKDGDKELGLGDFATTNWTSFLPALQQPPSGVQWQQQGTGQSSSAPTNKTIAQQTLDKSYKRKDK